MFGVSESREPIKGEFAKKLVALVNKMRKDQLEKQEKELKEDYQKGPIHNITIIDPNFDRFSLLMNTPLEDISSEDLQWASEQPYNSLTSKNIFLAEIERRKHES
jgi:hypothetical protein